MSLKLTIETIRAMASSKSFERGQEYFTSHRVISTAKRGGVLIGECASSAWTPYRIQVKLGKSGIEWTECTCPYEWGGICKHIVALLLAYLESPGSFDEQAELPDLLAGLSRDELADLIGVLVEHQPELYDYIAAGLEKLGTTWSRETFSRVVGQLSERDEYDEEEYYDLDEEW